MTVLRRLGLGALGVVLVVTGFPAASTADPAADIAAKQREAASVAAELEQLEDAADIAVERYLQAQLAADELREGIEDAQARVAQTQQALEGAQGSAHAAALRAYVRGADVSTLTRTLAVVEAGPDADLPTNGEVYGQIAIGMTRDVADELAAARADHEHEQAALTARLADQQAAVAAMDDARAAAEQAVSAQQGRLDSVQGELAELVRQEEERRRAEEERKAREEAERRAAAAAAARAAAAEAAARKAAEDAARRAAASATPPATTGSTARSTPAGGAPASSSTPATTPVVTAPVRSPRASANTAVQAALSQVGVPYRYAASSPGVGFDCSGLTMWAWAQAGVSLPHSSAAQFAGLTSVPMDQIQPGDLVAFGTPVHHIGMYIGNGQMVHAPQTGKDVRVVSINRRDLRGAVRP